MHKEKVTMQCPKYTEYLGSLKERLPTLITDSYYRLGEVQCSVHIRQTFFKKLYVPGTMPGDENYVINQM